MLCAMDCVLCTAAQELQYQRNALVPCSIVHKLLELLEDLLHLRHSTGAVHQLSYFWVSQLVRGDERQQSDGLACASRHLRVQAHISWNEDSHADWSGRSLLN